MPKRLGEAEWVQAGLRTLARHGVEAVRVESLAADLKVTKGSFYWHFKDRAALLERVLDAWMSRTTASVIATLEGEGGDARTRLEALLRISMSSQGRLERAVRAWAAQDPGVHEALQTIDDRRRAYLASLLTQLGLPPAESRQRARFAYHAMIGQFMAQSPPDKGARLKERIRSVLAMLTAKPQSGEGAARTISRLPLQPGKAKLRP